MDPALEGRRSGLTLEARWVLMESSSEGQECSGKLAGV